MSKEKILIGKISPEAIVKKYGSPLYVYDSNIIRERCAELRRNLKGIDAQYACKANTNPEVVRCIFKQGFGMETVSPGEIRVARRAGVPVSRITFTCAGIDERELIRVVRQGIRVHLDSLHQVEVIGKHFPGKEISVRLNQGIGAGHHSHVITGGPESKFGIDIAHIERLCALARRYRLRITGLHQHIGSNVLDMKIFLKAMGVLLKTALQFPDLKHLDFGGGFGVPYEPGEKRFDVAALGRAAKEKISGFVRRRGKSVRASFEPGRYLVAEAGFLLVQVTDVKRNPKKIFVGVNSGMGHLIRPALYGSYHDIVNASHPSARKERVTVAGNICESGDVFAKDRMLARPEIGDILIIKNAGAYGYVMSSDYNLRPRPREVLL